MHHGKKQAEGQSVRELPVRFHSTDGFCAWLQESGISLAFTSAKAGKIILVGQRHNRLKIFTRTLQGARAVFSRGDRLYVSAQDSLWTYVNVIGDTLTAEGYDALYYPRQIQVTGEVDMQDIYVPRDMDRSPIFANTQFSCIAALDSTYNFQPLWTPSFISTLSPEDRCHLTGMAIDPDTEQPRYVTIAAHTDYYEAWRLQRASGGAVLDIRTGQAVLEGLSIPHAPRLHNGHLYVLDTGGGRLGRVDEGKGNFEELCCFPGLAKGLTFSGQYAIVSVSGYKHKDSVSALPFYERASQENTVHHSEAAIHVVDLEECNILHTLSVDGELTDIDSIAVVDGKETPALVRLGSPAMKKLFYLPKSAAGKVGSSGAGIGQPRELKHLIDTHAIKNTDEFSLVNVFGAVTPDVQEALIGFWMTCKALPRRADPYVRASQACVLALNPDGEIMALTTVYKEPLEAVLPEKSKLDENEHSNPYYFMRTFTAPKYRHLNLGAFLAHSSYDVVKSHVVDSQKAGEENAPKGVVMVAENMKLVRPLVLKRFKRAGCDILPDKTPEGRILIRKMFE